MSNPEVDELLKKAVQAGFKSQGAKGRQSKFAAPAPAPAPASGPVDPKLQKAIAALQAAGYNVTK
jgi:hypothetical protein